MGNLISKITPKNTITIPTEIRKSLDAKPGDRVIFRINDDGEVVLRPIKQVSPDELYGALYRPENKYIPMRELRDQISEELSQEFRQEAGDTE